MSVEPPGAMRPVWKAASNVEPLANMCGSTSVACCPGPTENGSELIWVKLTLGVCAITDDWSENNRTMARAREAATDSFITSFLLKLSLWQRPVTDGLPGGGHTTRPEQESTTYPEHRRVSM